MNSAPAIEWQDGSLEELINMLSRPAIPVRIEVFDGDKAIGDVHLVAGGVAEAVFEGRRGDEVVADYERRRDLRFRVQARLPDPSSGALVPHGPDEGTLKERPLVQLMRYCEEYVLTCILEVWRGSERASIRYHRGEMTATEVDGKDAAERLPEVMTWTEGSYRIVLPPIVLPQSQTRSPRRAPTPAAGVGTDKVTTGERPVVESPVAAAAPAAVVAAPATTMVTAPTTPNKPTPAQPAAASPRDEKRPEGKRAEEKRPEETRLEERRPATMQGRPLGDLPLVVHLGLGLALGLAIVAAYWAIQMMGH